MLRLLFSASFCTPAVWDCKSSCVTLARPSAALCAAIPATTDRGDVGPRARQQRRSCAYRLQDTTRLHEQQQDGNALSSALETVALPLERLECGRLCCPRFRGPAGLRFPFFGRGRTTSPWRPCWAGTRPWRRRRCTSCCHLRAPTVTNTRGIRLQAMALIWQSAGAQSGHGVAEQPMGESRRGRGCPFAVQPTLSFCSLSRSLFPVLTKVPCLVPPGGVVPGFAAAAGSGAAASARVIPAGGK
jgi:hypothetical protein